MPPFPRPDFDYEYNLDEQREALRNYRERAPGRDIPAKRDRQLLLATWNIANLGDPAQARSDKDIGILAELISWYDVIALQEVKADVGDLCRLLEQLSPTYRVLFTDVGGNQERMATLYDSRVVEHIQLAGEIAVPPSDHRHIKISGIEQKYNGFDRDPFAVAFRSSEFRFTLVNAHLFFGSASTRDRNRRALEAYAVARWADLQGRRDYAFTPEAIVMGDLNIPKARPGDAIYDALTKRGLEVPEHTTQVGSTLADDNHYDQLAFFPGVMKQLRVRSGVFDFDGAIFSDLWRARPDGFQTYVRYHISDHRPLWAQFDLALR